MKLQRFPTRLVLAAAAAVMLSGCGHPVYKMQFIQAPAIEPIWSGHPSKLAEPSYFEAQALRKRFAHEIVATHDKAQHCPTPREMPFSVGVALSGGGARAAAYSMGVLQTLWNEDVLTDDVDIVSAVSGGGYAAYWYYSRLADFYLESQRSKYPPARGELHDGGGDETQQLTHDFFSECLPFRYSGLLPPENRNGTGGTVCPAADPRWLSPDGNDRWRYQNHLRGY